MFIRVQILLKFEFKTQFKLNLSKFIKSYSFVENSITNTDIMIVVGKKGQKAILLRARFISHEF
jgi:hypothetical protein